MAEAAAASKTPPPRLGPRPLPQHLLTAMLGWTSSLASWRSWSAASPESRPPLPESLRPLGPELASLDPEDFAAALQREAMVRLDRLAAGIVAYRAFPLTREIAEPPVAWRQGTTRLLDFSGLNRERRRTAAPRPAVLVVPSLINRAYVLDLDEERSLMRFLAGEGFAAYLLDWGAPGALERGFTLSDYIAGRIGDALDAVRRREPDRPTVLLGYCMGGLLALAAAQARQRDLAGLVLMATPWDFHAEHPEQARLIGAIGASLEPMLARLGEMPVDALQSLFAGVDPFQVLRKFLAFAGLDPASDKARLFVALEDWLNDGVPLAAPVARECLQGWYGENEPARRRWRVAGAAIDPDRVTLPTLVVVPDQDRIVPPASALALAKALPQARRLMPAAGHIGMVVGGSAKPKLWHPLADWMASLRG
ncbi:MAG TPA: alpha/beta fold hydrolase [Hypericibacter adhaerens]|uniref:alpha/beta fold hydrolase n=1 Tax=Hypericibacter adhaerens TaxID=2602016 RepID=UPI002C0FBFF5|nr:alpha/beta fold hydrolase [Hypericibacter adhaerens]HWA42348.1 alpha/beta fold hydrolase [Hypericibacter adhaerens]